MFDNIDYTNLQYDYFNGENFVGFDIIAVDEDRNEITLIVSNQGKITMQSFDLLSDKSGNVFYEYGPSFERIYLRDFN